MDLRPWACNATFPHENAKGASTWTSQQPRDKTPNQVRSWYIFCSSWSYRFCSLSGPEEGCRSSSISRKIQDLSGWKQPLKTQENEPHDPCMPPPWLRIKSAVRSTIRIPVQDRKLPSTARVYLFEYLTTLYKIPLDIKSGRRKYETRGLFPVNVQRTSRTADHAE